MRRRLLYHTSNEKAVTYTYSLTGNAYIHYETVSANGGSGIFPSYWVEITETGSDGSTKSITYYSGDENIYGLEFYFNIVIDNRDDVSIDNETGELTVGKAVDGEGYYGVGTVTMTVTLGSDKVSVSDLVTQAMNPVEEYTTTSIDVTQFYYDAASAVGGDNLYPNLEFTVTETTTYSDGKTPTENTYFVSYHNGELTGNNYSPTFSIVSGSFHILSNNGMIYDITEAEETGDGTIDIGEVRVRITAGGTTADDYTTITQNKKEEKKSDTYFPMDILMLNNETHKQEIFDRTGYSYNDYPKEKYTPIGLILTPDPIHSSTSGYGSDWKGVIALTDASLSNPETGDSSPSEILCGSSECYSERMRTVDESPNINEVPSLLPYCDNSGTPTDNIVDVIDDIDGYPNYNSNVVSAATDKNSTVMSTTDAFAGYANTTSHKAMSPYTVSEEEKDKYSDIYNDFWAYNEKAYDKCEGYGDKVISALSDYNGQFNSLAILLGKSWTKGREWIENNTSNSNTAETDCPAVEACWKYAPEGTAQGGWYLPGLGELSLMVARFNKINETLSLINEYYGVAVSPLKDTSVPYLSSTHFTSSMFDDNADKYVDTSTLYALFPNISGDAGYNRVCTTTLSGTTRNRGYVRPFKKIKSVDTGYELMPAHYTQTFCDGDSDREWFGQKFIVSFRRGCMADISNLTGGNFGYLRVYGYKVKGENDTTKVDSNPRLLAEVSVSELTMSSADTWPTYNGNEKGLNIVGRFTTTPIYEADGAFDRITYKDLDIDTDEFERDGTVEPGWYVLYGIGVTGLVQGGVDTQEYFVTNGSYETITKKEIDTVTKTKYGETYTAEDKEAFFDTIKTTAILSLSDRTEKPFYVGQFDRPVALLIESNDVGNND